MSEKALPKVMVDLETAGRDRGDAILSIGAQKFDVGTLGETFHQNVSLASCDAAGLDIEGETVEFWAQQENVQDVLAGGVDLETALVEFTEFYGDANEIWARSPQFDCEILKSGYAVVGLNHPWSFRDERCQRTISALDCALEKEHDGTKHAALNDAKHQAAVASETLRRMPTGEST